MQGLRENRDLGSLPQKAHGPLQPVFGHAVAAGMQAQSYRFFFAATRPCSTPVAVDNFRMVGSGIASIGLSQDCQAFINIPLMPVAIAPAFQGHLTVAEPMDVDQFARAAWTCSQTPTGGRTVA